MDRQQAINQMNQWGREGRAFFFLIDFDEKNPEVILLENTAGEGIYFSVPGFGNTSESFFSNDLTMPENALRHDGYPLDAYKRQFDEVMRHILAGDSFLTNLTCCTPVRSNFSLKELYGQVQARYKLLYKDLFLCFSPETFVRIRDGVLSSCPMKGTLDASLPDATNQLLNNPKEKAEHCTIVDLIRNDLSIVASEVRVNRFRYVDEIRAGERNLLQVSSEICANPGADYASRLGDLVFAMLPAGSVTGAPKKKTVEIIRSAESYERGYYTGIFGIFDGKDLDSAVLIRFLEKTTDGLVYKSGGGITSQSNMLEEYDEMLKKIYVPLH